MSDRVREVFWVLVLGIIVAFAFFFVLGGIAPGDAVVACLVVLALCVMWGVHAWLTARAAAGRSQRDPRIVSARERRGF